MSELSSSNYIGVSKKKKDKNWRAQITFKNQSYHIGMFALERDAAIAVDKFRIKKGLEPVNILKRHGIRPKS